MRAKSGQTLNVWQELRLKVLTMANIMVAYRIMVRACWPINDVTGPGWLE